MAFGLTYYLPIFKYKKKKMSKKKEKFDGINFDKKANITGLGQYQTV